MEADQSLADQILDSRSGMTLKKSSASHCYDPGRSARGDPLTGQKKLGEQVLKVVHVTPRNQNLSQFVLKVP